MASIIPKDHCSVRAVENAVQQSVPIPGTDDLNMSLQMTLLQREDEALPFALKAAKVGHPIAYVMLLYLHRCNFAGEVSVDECKRQLEKKIGWIREQAESGNALAQNALGWCYNKGEAVETDKTSASVWYRKSGEGGFALAYINLGFLYLREKSLGKSSSEGAFCFTKAAEMGLPLAYVYLGHSFQKGDQGKKDLAKAFECYIKAAEGGCIFAQNKVGWFFHRGIGTEQDFSLAKHWYRQAALRGVSFAKKRLAELEDQTTTADETARDQLKKTNTTMWYLEKAYAGHAWAQYIAGRCFARGFGVEQSYAEAVSWYQKAAAGGDEQAKAKLAALGEK